MNTPAQKRAYDRLGWTGQAAFQVATWRDWEFKNLDGTLRKDGEEKRKGKPKFVSVDGAGHTSPGDQPEAVWSVMKGWIENERY